MKGRLRKLRNLLCCLTGALAVAAVSVPAVTSHAEEIYPGVYTVQVVPTYQNPVTGVVEDVGQNPGLGQMMVEAQVQSVGCVEIEDDGTIWLNMRWNLESSNIYAGFATSPSGEGFQAVDYQVTNQVEAGDYEFMGQTFAATVTDFRFQLQTLDDIVRCSNYVDAMGREVVFFCYLQNLQEGVSSSWSTIQVPSMSEYSERVNAISEEAAAAEAPAAAETEEPAETTAAATEAAGPTIASRTAAEVQKETKESGETAQEIGNKSADELLDGAKGIDGAEETKAAATASSGGASMGTVVLAVVIGVLVGGAAVAGVLCGISRKKKKQEDLFSDVDEKDERK